MAVARAAVPAGIDVLLSVLSCEVDVVSHFALGLARHAGVAIGDVKTTRVACVPVCVTFDEVRVRGLLLWVPSNVRGAAWRGVTKHGAPSSCGRGICRRKHTAHPRGMG